MSNNSDERNTAAEGVEMAWCEECQGHFEVISTDNGTFLNCDCPSSSTEGFEELDFND